MAVCTFFGHRDTPTEIEPILYSALIDLIENKKTDTFYVGNNGNFDRMAEKNLRKLKEIYPQIMYYIVLAYFPHHSNNYTDYSNTIFPEELENIFPRFAIIKRNDWMLNKSDYVVTYVKYTASNYALFVEKAKRKGKKIIALFYQ